jgi:MarR family transcriptional regulator for hemolysin
MLDCFMCACIVIFMIRKQDDLVGSMLHDIAHLVRLRIDEALKPYGLTRLKWLAIGIISNSEGFSQAELASQLELRSAATGRLVDRLVERGLVERHADKDDRRAYRLFATPKSEALLLDLEPLGERLRKEILNGLDQEEAGDLKNSLTKIKANLLSGAAVLVSAVALKSEIFLPMV